jgi:GDP-L-fucose synthase
MDVHNKILITGVSGVIGNALKSELISKGYKQVQGISSSEVDLTNIQATKTFFDDYRPDYVFHMAGRVYGLGGNLKYGDKLINDNLQMNMNVINACADFEVKKIICMGTVAMYPDISSGIFTEDQIWYGYPHASEEFYSVAKLATLTMLKAYKKNRGLNYVMPISTNLYGENDRFNSETGHVVPSLIKKFYDALINQTEVVVWGTGKAQRDFLYSKDAARGLIMLANSNYEVANLASGRTITIAEVVEALSEITGIKKIHWDSSKPDGQLHRNYNINKLSSLGFKPEYDTRDGLKNLWEWYISNQANLR